jgi:hypothetical protein
LEEEEDISSSSIMLRAEPSAVGSNSCGVLSGIVIEEANDEKESEEETGKESEEEAEVDDEFSALTVSCDSRSSSTSAESSATEAVRVDSAAIGVTNCAATPTLTEQGVQGRLAEEVASVMLLTEEEDAVAVESESTLAKLTDLTGATGAKEPIEAEKDCKEDSEEFRDDSEEVEEEEVTTAFEAGSGAKEVETGKSTLSGRESLLGIKGSDSLIGEVSSADKRTGFTEAVDVDASDDDDDEGETRFDGNRAAMGTPAAEFTYAATDDGCRQCTGVLPVLMACAFSAAT